MKIQTIHRNQLGEVVNEIRADAVRFTDDDGKLTVLSRGEDGKWRVGHYHTPEQIETFRREALDQLAVPKSLFPAQRADSNGTCTCYQCGKAVTWLAPDSRCADCTHLSPDEVRGE